MFTYFVRFVFTWLQTIHLVTDNIDTLNFRLESLPHFVLNVSGTATLILALIDKYKKAVQYVFIAGRPE